MRTSSLARGYPGAYPGGVRLDRSTLAALESRGVLNWCLQGDFVSRLLTLMTASDGNCLLHGASLGLVGAHDKKLELRDLLYRTLTGDSREILRQRWRATQSSRNQSVVVVNLEEDQWDEEWNSLVTRAQEPGKSLEDFHVYVLAFALGRPIIVYSSTVCMHACVQFRVL